MDIENATSNNLRNLTVRIPKGVLTCVTGVAGSGKSSLVAEFVDTLRHWPAGNERRGEAVVGQRAVGRSSRSNPATCVGVFDPIRRAFAAANRIARALQASTPGFLPGCKGRGFLEVELSFLDDVRLDCKLYEGRRYRDDVLELTYHVRSIHDVSEMEEPRKRSAGIERGLQLLVDVGVGYLRLGQSLYTLSGGSSAATYVAAVRTLPPGAVANAAAFRFEVEATRYALRCSSAAWKTAGRRRSFYAGPERRVVHARVDKVAPAWRQVPARPDLAAINALLLVVDTVNTRPGTSGVLTVGAVRVESRPVDCPPFPQGAGRSGQVRTVSRK